MVVGAIGTVRSLARTLMHAEAGPKLVGAVVIDGAAARCDRVLLGIDEAVEADPVRPRVSQLPVWGGVSELETILDKAEIDLVLVSLPVAMAPIVQRVQAVLQASGVAWRFLPTLEDQLEGRCWVRSPMNADAAAAGNIDSVTLMGLVDPMRLLDRKAHDLDVAAIGEVLRGRRVLITGAGGSIGSEIARQVARFDVKQVILLDRSENALFEIDRLFAERYPGVNRTTRLHDVTDASSTMVLMNTLRPDVVFHAAAHKHVGVMEDHPAAAIENNFFGTRAIADAADRIGVQRFVMISTDKAVRPKSIMGASKRLAELYVQFLGTRSRTRFSIVRFGNVLGSACSVLPIWMSQLTRGDSITVTDPAMTRYFMTIPEAAGLVLQAASLQADEPVAHEAGGKGGRVGGAVLLLDMGEPIRILDLAKRFLRLQGLEPDIDATIRITGARPGEKLHEELVYADEEVAPTAHPAIRRWRHRPPSDSRMMRQLQLLDQLRTQGPGRGARWQLASRDAIVAALRELIPEMQVEPEADAATSRVRAAAG